MHFNHPVLAACTHQTYDTLLRVAGRRSEPAVCESVSDPDRAGSVRDRGAVSLEQVLWFVAAGVSVAAISIILWTRLRTEAENAPINQPVAP